RRGSAIGAIRASDYGMASDYADTAGDNLMIICQIETVAAVDNIDAIAAVPGIDLLFIGPYDLSGSAGHFGNIAHPDVGALIARAKKGIADAGGPVGTVPHPGGTWQDMFDQGYDMVTGGSDVNFLRDPALAAIKDFDSQYNKE
ncbi:MAG: aldolase/citrate lyase family protein, partial [Alphaproteobacteria bacterium]